MSNLAEYARIYPDVLSPELCQEIIDQFEKDPRKFPGRVGGGYQPGVKQSLDLAVDPSCPKWQRLDQEMFKALHHSFNLYCDDCPQMSYILRENLIIDSGYQIQRYMPNTGDQFKWHIDSGGTSSDRILAAIIYLNDVEEGGETEFDLGGKKALIKPERGSILWFPPTFMYPHRGLPTISGPKYIVTTFMIYDTRIYNTAPREQEALNV